MAKTITRAATNGKPAKSDTWRTPRELFEALNAEFSFAWDLAADKSNHLAPEWFGPGSSSEVNALASDLDWEVEIVNYAKPPARIYWAFLNPPYSAKLIKPFMAKVRDTMARSTRLGIVTLTPDDHSTQWYRALDGAAELRRIPHRVPYLKPVGRTLALAGAMFPSCVGIFRPQIGVWHPHAPRVVAWSWKGVEHRLRAAALHERLRRASEGE